MFFRSKEDKDKSDSEPPKQKVGKEKSAASDFDQSEPTQEEYQVESDLDEELNAGEGKGLRVVIKESNQVELDFTGEKQTQETSTGSLKVQNTGKTNRITGITLALDDIQDIDSETDIEESTNIGVLAPGRENDFAFDYTFERELEPIKVEQEYYDPENGLSPNFLGGADTDFNVKIVVTNTSEETIYQIKGTKTLNDLASVQDSSIESGEITQEGNEITFEIDEIESGDSVELVLNLRAALPDDVPAYQAGDLVVTYEHHDNLTSGLRFKSIDGVSDFRRRIRRRQRETEPSFYDCEIIFENRSEFSYDLDKFSVFADNLESQQMILDWDGAEATEEERELPPSDKVSFEFVYESLEGTPSFGDILEFSIQSETLITAETKITIPGRELKFMAIKITKVFLDENGEESNEFEIPSYIETEVPTLVTLTGVGTYPLEGLVIRDEIPEGFRVDDVDDVAVERNGNPLDADRVEITIGGTKRYDQTQSSRKVTTTDDDDDTEVTGGDRGDAVEGTESNQSLIVFINHLEETDDDGFNEDETITVRYTVIADKLEPRDDPIRVQAHGEGYIYEDEDARVYAHSNLEGLNMMVVHLRDDVDISKYISARDYDGRDAYRIELEAENYGSSTVDMEIQDLIPEGFELVEDSIETDPSENVDYAEPSTVKDGLLHGWTFRGVEPDNRIKASFLLVEIEEDANPRKLQSVYKG